MWHTVSPTVVRGKGRMYWTMHSIRKKMLLNRPTTAYWRIEILLEISTKELSVIVWKLSDVYFDLLKMFNNWYQTYVSFCNCFASYFWRNGNFRSIRLLNYQKLQTFFSYCFREDGWICLFYFLFPLPSSTLKCKAPNYYSHSNIFISM